MMRMVFIGGACAFACLAGGCRPYNAPKYDEIKSNESAFLIPLETDPTKQQSFESVEFLKNNQVAEKRVQVKRRWVQTGRLWFSGQYLDTVRVIKVDRTPVTRSWTADAKSGTAARNEAIWVESQDSVGLSMDIICTAMIDPADVPLFLFRYPSGSLAQVMDGEIRGRIQQELAEECAKFPLEELKRNKTPIITRVRLLVSDFAQERGITITTLGLGGGLAYENPKIQEAIDRTCQDQQLQVQARAKYEAQVEDNKRIEIEAQTLATAAKTRAAGEAEAIKALADAKAYEIAKAQGSGGQYVQLRQLEIALETAKRWDGRLPVYSFGGGGVGAGGEHAGPSLFFGVPGEVAAAKR